jgi:transcriptional regulator with XRE-family HTH domain
MATSGYGATPSDHTASRIREVRRRRNMTVRDLAARCAELGVPRVTGPVIENIENGRRDDAGRRRRNVTVDELMVIALALNVPPLYLVIPPGDPDALYRITPAEAETRRYVAAWAAGEGPILPRMPKAGEVREYYAELPDEQFMSTDAVRRNR